MILEIIEGPETGRRVKLREGETITLGRTERAMQRFAEDSGMSGLHLAVGLSGGSLRMQNLSQTNGTLVNGVRVESGALQSGDKIRAGGTVFVVIGPPPSPYLAQMRVGGWGFNVIPEGWTLMEGVALIREGGEFRASAAGSEESLPGGQTIRDYIQVQMDIAKSRLKDAEFQGPEEARMQGSEEALLLTVTSETAEGMRIPQRQIYARSGEVVGILTLSGLADANQDFIEIVRGASFHKPRIPA
jgi:hypothetical protein